MSNEKKQDTAAAVVQMQVNGQERKLVELLRRLDYGEVRIVVKGSEIVQVEEKKSIKL